MSDSLRVLLTNDDGIDAPGLKALREAFSRLEQIEVYVAAPDRERSTCSHGMTLGRTLTAEKVDPCAFAVNGLPADCVFLAQNGLFPKPPHAVVSGINNGANLGSDVIYSGTAAGARQAVLMGIHGIATSLAAGEDFEIAAQMTAELVVRIMQRPPSSPVLLNLNFPKGRPSAIKFGSLGTRRYPQKATLVQSPDSRQTVYQPGSPTDVEDALIPGSDGWLIHRNIASATLLRLDQTDLSRMKDPDFFVEGIEPL
jgi:5'-nucleotidase